MSRYVWLSSVDRPGGASPGAPVHMVRRVDEKTDAVLIAEGSLKGDRTAQEWGMLALAVVGVGNWRDVPDVVCQLRPRQVVIGYDMDLLRNPVVRRHAADLVTALRQVELYLGYPEVRVERKLANTVYEIPSANKDAAGVNTLAAKGLKNPVSDVTAMVGLTLKFSRGGPPAQAVTVL